ncbi:hypothetical protein SDD27957_04090 [Streptococcus dysgalactiae subsp. dysgalactiae ATCC 27957]|nr:hypothetical protein SDD27957_04090 [Streptococcus dysgalactiae subsp. dysgalactiae ATCC 27957]
MKGFFRFDTFFQLIEVMGKKKVTDIGCFWKIMLDFREQKGIIIIVTDFRKR